MDNILSCYKDGQNGTSNCRYFAVVHPIARMIFLSSFMWTEGVFIFLVEAVVMIISGMFITLIRPYKSAIYNALDTLHSLCVAVSMVGIVAYFVTYVEGTRNRNTSFAIIFLPVVIHFLYIIFYLEWKCWAFLKCLRIFVIKMVSRLALSVH